MKAAWPAANETVAGARPASRIAIGSSTQRTVVLVPISVTRIAPTMNPAAVPSSARTMFWPVFSALERRTARVPKTTQNACWTPLRSATRTATPSPAAPRTLLRSDSDCRLM